MDFSFFEELNTVVQEEPADATDPETLGLLASIGIEKGKPFAPDARMKKILAEAAAVANATARADVPHTAARCLLLSKQRVEDGVRRGQPRVPPQRHAAI
jgi:hypothetical protein